MWSSLFRLRLAELMFHNKRLLYGVLFRASVDALLEVAANPKRLRAKIGFLSVLHTWGQTLNHPYVDCVIPAGGISSDHKAWVHPRYRFFLPVKVLSKVFRREFIDAIERAHRNKERCLPGALKR